MTFGLENLAKVFFLNRGRIRHILDFHMLKLSRLKLICRNVKIINKDNSICILILAIILYIVNDV